MVNSTIDIDADTARIDQWFAHMIVSLACHFGDGCVPMHDLVAAELDQEL